MLYYKDILYCLLVSNDAQWFNAWRIAVNNIPSARLADAGFYLQFKLRYFAQ
jgi:hypothetical protein